MAVVSMERFANDSANGLLASDINNSTTSVALSTGHGARFPSVYPYRIRVEDELMLVTNKSGDTFTVTRAIESTSAASHVATTPVTAVLTKGAMERWLPDYAHQPRHNNFLGESWPFWLLDNNVQAVAPVAQRISFSKIYLPEPVSPTKLWWYHMQAAATTSADVYAQLFDSGGNRIGKSVEMVAGGLVPAALGIASVTISAESAGTLTNIGGPGVVVFAGIYVGTVGNFLMGNRRPANDLASSANPGLVAGVDLPDVALRAATDAPPPDATIPILSAGFENRRFWFGLS